MNVARAALLGAVCLASAVSAPAQGPAPDLPFLEIGSTPGKLDVPARCYLLNAEPGSGWDIQVKSTKIDSFLIVGVGRSCDNFTSLLRNDDSGGGLNSRIKFSAPKGGVYIVRVTSRGDGRGDYELLLERGEGRPIAMAGLEIEGAPSPTANAVPEHLSASTAPGAGREVVKPGSRIQDCPECPVMVAIPAGSFMMGSPADEEGRGAEEGPRHMVRIARPFAIGAYEVTFDEWDACVKDRGCSRQPRDNGWGKGRRPVIDVSWRDATQYVRWLRKKTGEQYFLPSEAEWEYVTRAGTDTPWNTGKAIITDDANILNALGRTVPVGGFPPNAFGVHDTHGNVREWVMDCYEVGYFGTPVDGGAMAADGCKVRVMRGGSYLHPPLVGRSASRPRHEPDKIFNDVGFRVARAL